MRDISGYRAANVARFVARLNYEEGCDPNAVTARAVAKALQDVANAYTTRASMGGRTRIPESFKIEVDMISGTSALIITEVYKEQEVDYQNSNRSM